MTKSQITPIRLTPAEHQSAKLAAERHGFGSLSAFVRAAVAFYVKWLVDHEPDSF